MRRSFVLIMCFAAAACGGKVFVDSSTGSSTGGGTAGAGAGAGAGGAPGVGGFTGDGGSLSCFACACGYLLSEGGCEDVCTMGLNGTTTPNFCDGTMALSQCAACIANVCGEPVPTNCGM